MLTVYAAMHVVGPPIPFQWQVPAVSVRSWSPVQAVIQWKNENDRHPDHWMITLTSSVEDKIYFYTLDGRTSKQKLPVQLTPRTNYTVTLAAVFKPSRGTVPVPSHWMYGESTVTFTTPATG